MLNVNDKIKIWCAPWEENVEVATVLSIDTIGLEDDRLLQDGKFVLVVVIVQMSGGEICPLLCVEDPEMEGIEVDDLDWRFPRKAPSDVQIRIVKENK